ncbi:MAG: MgtC/SapB family protein [Candidatus Melainabacteria bacterium]|nr:MgtC/SapB family protein [Candidatus Melainabacteria bacterium]
MNTNITPAGSSIFDSVLAWIGQFLQASDLALVGVYLPHLLVAFFLGFLIGLERRYRRKSAGVRTYMVVCVTACLVAVTGFHLYEITKVGDPARLAHGVLNGIGFVGAGVILTRGINRSGITTASTILFAVGVGVACGLGIYALAAVTTVLLLSLIHISYRFFPGSYYGGNALRIVCPVEKFREVRKLFGTGYRIDRIQKHGHNVEFHIQTHLTERETDLLIARQVHNEDVISIEMLWEPSD